MKNMKEIIEMVKGQIASASEDMKKVAHNIATKTKGENFTFEDGIIFGSKNQKDKDDFERSSDFHERMLHQYRNGKFDGLEETLCASWKWIEKMILSQGGTPDFVKQAKDKYFEDIKNAVKIPV